MSPLISTNLVVCMTSATKGIIMIIITIRLSTTAQISWSLKKTVPNSITFTIIIANIMAEVVMQMTTIITMMTMMMVTMIEEKCNRHLTPC